MRALPPTTLPASEPIARRHAPDGAWASFRACLRWEFGFTCAFCLLHEADFLEHGAEGSGLFATEHHVARAVQHDSQQRGDRHDRNAASHDEGSNHRARRFLDRYR